MSRFMSRFVIFSNSKKSNISNPTVFAGGANSRRSGRVGPSRRRLVQPAPGPAGDIFKITGPSPTRPARFQSHATSARPRQRVSNLTGRLPGLAREILRIFSLFIRAMSPPPRGFEAATTCSLARAPRLLWESLALYNRCTKQSLPCPCTGLWIPLVRCGLRSALARHISSHVKMSQIFIFWGEKLKKIMS